MKAIIVIPARLESTRLPRKLLLNETGKPLIQHTWEQAMWTTKAQRVIIAVDNMRMVDECQSFGAEVMLTLATHRNGTERVNEVCERLGGSTYQLYVNWQADEPEVEPLAVDEMIAYMFSNVDSLPSPDIGTLSAPLNSESLNDPSCVKVVSNDSRAIFFTRFPLPYAKHHIGIYAYWSGTLEDVANEPISSSEGWESLEQMRFVVMGKDIEVVHCNKPSRGIDTLADYDAFVERQKEMVPNG